jgi:hypothetical protein
MREAAGSLVGADSSVGRHHARHKRMTEKTKGDPKPLDVTARMTREEFELACIREFSHSGLYLGLGVSREERRERIRTAILQEHKAHRRWQKSDLTYADVYTQVYHQSLGANDSHEEGRARQGSERRQFAIDDDFADEEAAFEGNDGTAT